MTKSSLFDQLLQAFGGAVADVREKVVEEPWFGKPTSPSQQPQRAENFDSLTGGVGAPAMEGSEVKPQAHLPPREVAPVARPGTKEFDAYVAQIKEGDRIFGGLTDPNPPGRSKFDALTEQFQRLQGHEPERSLDRDRDLEH